MIDVCVNIFPNVRYTQTSGRSTPASVAAHTFDPVLNHVSAFISIFLQDLISTV